jgi:hypothetical protein
MQICTNERERERILRFLFELELEIESAQKKVKKSCLRGIG